MSEDISPRAEPDVRSTHYFADVDHGGQLARRDGYRAHLAADPETGIIIDEKLTKAAGQENSDPAVAGEFLAAGAGQDNPCPAAVQGSPACAHDADGGLAGQPGPDTASHGSRSSCEAGGDSGEEPLVRVRPDVSVRVRPHVPVVTGGFPLVS